MSNSGLVNQTPKDIGISYKSTIVQTLKLVAVEKLMGEGTIGG